MGIEAVSQFGYRPYLEEIGGNNCVWRVTWQAPGERNESLSYFRPRMVVAPS